MDIYSSSKKAKHSKANKKAKKGNIFSRITESFRAMSAKKRSIVIALIVFLLVLVLVTTFVVGYIIKLSVKFNHDDDFDVGVEQPISKDIVNIALFGLDTRSKTEFTGRSDSIMILSLDKKDGKIKIISVMRDSLVQIPGYSNPRKINTAYALGGPELAVKTLNENFGLDISEYAAVNFYGMADIIDAVGGIEVNVLASEIKSINAIYGAASVEAGDNTTNSERVQKPGRQVLDGKEAVAWARIRSVATESGEKNDFGRTDRQRYVMEQLLNKVKAMSVSRYPALIDEMLPYMKTSLSVSDIAGLSSVISKNAIFEESRVPHDEYIINANYNISGVGATVYYNVGYASKVLLAYIYDNISPKDYFEQNGIDKTGWYGSGVSTNKPGSSTSQSTTSSATQDSDSSLTETEGSNSDVNDSSSQGVSSEETVDTNVEEDSAEEEPTASDADEPIEDDGATEDTE